MANNLFGGYLPSTFPTGMPGEFDEEQTQIARRRAQLMELMQRPVGDRNSGWQGGVANMLQGILQSQQLGQYDDQSSDVARRRAEAANSWLGQMPQDTPAQPEVNPSMPMPGIEGPPVPTNYTPPVDQATGMVPKPMSYEHVDAQPMVPAGVKDMALWAGRGAGFSPMHAKFAEKALETAVTAPEKRLAAAEAAGAKADMAKAARDARAHEMELARVERGRLAENAAAEKEKLQEYRAADKLQQDQYRAADRESLKAIAVGAASAAAGKGVFVDQGTSERGNPVLRNTRGTDYVEIVNGQAVPYTGKIVKTGEEKAVSGAMAGQAQIDYTKQLAERAAKPENEKAFSTKANIGGTLSSKTEGYISPNITGKLSDEHQELRGEVYRNFAELIHQMYGSAYTAGEQARGGTYTVLPGDRADRVKQKLRAQAAFLQEMDAKYSAKIRDAATTRRGGDTRKPISEY